MCTYRLKAMMCPSIITSELTKTHMSAYIYYIVLGSAIHVWQIIFSIPYFLHHHHHRRRGIRNIYLIFMARKYLCFDFFAWC